MNKKGFTLVELLAVIAILAILIVLAVPNIIGIFNQSTKDAFVDEARSIYKAAEQQIILNQMKYSGTSITKFYSGSSNAYEKIDLENNTVSYCIKLSGGKISSFKMTNSRYSVNISSISSVEDIDSSDVSSAITISSCN